LKGKKNEHMDRLDEIAERLRRLRLAYGFQQARPWCQFVGIGETSWNAFERGHRRITLDEALKLCAKTGASLDWIFRGLEYMLPLHVAEKLAAVPDEELELTDRRFSKRAS
jgi:transcriptional regulator with XRE-family HTH domain